MMMQQSQPPTQPTVTAIISGNRKKFHTSLPDGSESVEEYDTSNGALMVRKRREKVTTASETKTWKYEVGEPEARMAILDGNSQTIMTENVNNPIFVVQDSVPSYVWRVRNIFYPQEKTYQVSCQPRDRKITIRTTNKKYFKVFNIPDMDALGLPYEEDKLSWSYSSPTLIIRYEKPPQIKRLEEEKRKEREKVPVVDQENCKTQ
ncbi:protein DPCD [Planoprotostelium fungivorum]|uniref:Protein DPCD n=1 Tax=Planoprotostelium fungivorum TaxID=1890364 RepID=A0A2P6NHG0_9EUKA|nr:protein DPCD [Planoprotostelium fungivorum]